MKASRLARVPVHLDRLVRGHHYRLLALRLARQLRLSLERRVRVYSNSVLQVHRGLRDGVQQRAAARSGPEGPASVGTPTVLPRELPPLRCGQLP